MSAKHKHRAMDRPVTRRYLDRQLTRLYTDLTRTIIHASEPEQLTGNVRIPVQRIDWAVRSDGEHTDRAVNE